jgi:hypothetical protein
MKIQTLTTPLLLLSAIAFFLTFGSVTACTSLPTSEPTPMIDNEKAIEQAIRRCKRLHLVLVGNPTNIHTSLLSLEEADKLIKTEGEITYYRESMDTKVWLIQMDGQLQLVGGPEP